MLHTGKFGVLKVKMVKIGVHLRKLSQKYTRGIVFGPLCTLYSAYRSYETAYSRELGNCWYRTLDKTADRCGTHCKPRTNNAPRYLFHVRASQAVANKGGSCASCSVISA